MNNWFTVKVKYTKQLDDGQLKRVTEPYLLAAMTFTDAEARIYEELGSSIRGEFNVVGIARTELHDIFAYDDAERWFKAKVVYNVQAEEEEKEKKVTQQFLVAAHSVKDAFERLGENLSGMLVDFQIPSITLSPIVEVFPFYDEEAPRVVETPVEREEEHTPGPKGQVFSASGVDVDDLDNAFIEEHTSE
jgi:hypothetical protein